MKQANWSEKLIPLTKNIVLIFLVLLVECEEQKVPMILTIFFNKDMMLSVFKTILYLLKKGLLDYIYQHHIGWTRVIAIILAIWVN